MYLLSPDEEKNLFRENIIHLKKRATKFLIKIGGDEKSLPLLTQIVRLFLLAKIYDAFDMIDEKVIQSYLQDIEGLKKYISSFRKKVQIYQSEIQKIVRSGMKLRQEQNPKFPSFFKDKDRVYLKINPVSSGRFYIQNLIDGINLFMPCDFRLSLLDMGEVLFIQTKKDRLVRGKFLGTKAGRYFKKRSSYLSMILRGLSQPSLESVSLELYDYFNLASSHLMYKDGFLKLSPICRRLFPRALMCEDLFYVLKSKAPFKDINDFKNKVQALRDFYLKAFHEIHLMQTSEPLKKRQDAVIDMLIISKSAYDIATMSAYARYSKNEWASCMLPNGLNAHYLPKEVGSGVFVVFGVNSKNPLERLARISVKPYLNNQGEVYYGAGYMYGVMMPQVKEQLNCFLSAYQPQLKGSFNLSKDVYRDATESAYYFDVSALDIVREKGFPVQKRDDDSFEIGSPENCKNDDIVNQIIFELLNESSEPRRLEISMDSLSLKSSFERMDIYASFYAYGLTKSKCRLLPRFAHELVLTSSNIQNLKSVRTNFKKLQVDLTSSLSSLDGISSDCRSVEFGRVQIQTPCFKVPETVEEISLALTKFFVQEIDLSEFNGVFKLQESNDFFGFERIVFPKKAKKFYSMLTRFSTDLVFDASCFEEVEFWGDTSFKEFKTGGILKSLLMSGAKLPASELDFSNLDYLYISNTSFEKVSKLVLPKSGRVIVQDCVFPQGLSLKKVLENGGFERTNTFAIASQKVPVLALKKDEIKLNIKN